MEITTFLMFEGQAEAAMTRYVALFPNARVVSLERYGAGEAGKEGSIKHAVFELSGTRVICFDSPVAHAFTFTPSVSLFVDCDDEAQLDRLFVALVEGGSAMMGLGDYGFSRRFGWLQDRFGVSWQLNLP
jgi:predicted 3-demethylubiquinone-9 3-methyltransferase (glyoxalase superfamily)